MSAGSKSMVPANAYAFSLPSPHLRRRIAEENSPLLQKPAIGGCSEYSVFRTVTQVAHEALDFYVSVDHKASVRLFLVRVVTLVALVPFDPSSSLQPGLDCRISGSVFSSVRNNRRAAEVQRRSCNHDATHHASIQDKTIYCGCPRLNKGPMSAAVDKDRS